MTVEEDISPPPRAAGGGQGETAAAAAPLTLKLKMPSGQTRAAPSGQTRAAPNAPVAQSNAHVPQAALPPLKLTIGTAPGQQGWAHAGPRDGTPPQSQAAIAADTAELANIDAEIARFRQIAGSVSDFAHRAKLQAKIAERSRAREAILARLGR